MIGYVGLGSNLGDREGHLVEALDAMRRDGVLPRAVSSVWETEAVDCRDPWPFLNMVAQIEVRLSPQRLLARLQAIERKAGRQRAGRNAARQLDLDLLLLGDLRLDTPTLKLPHPRMWRRGFVLAPLAELAPGLREPATGRTVRELAEAHGSSPWVRRLGVLAGSLHARL